MLSGNPTIHALLHHFIIAHIDDGARMEVNLVVVAHIQNIVFLNFSNAVTPDITGLVTINSEVSILGNSFLLHDHYRCDCNAPSLMPFPTTI
ncbi:hypothetical protein [Aggregatibacter actinomycetemcomitans]|uniref:hypothetical protein n=1 Tax=Aggregatibacter actinomycetemcomitans TaxID=714 RepID=UPI0002AC97E6|nr:hypothetical protein [Aggregatibacter actinomycetemcomitans]